MRREIKCRFCGALVITDDEARAILHADPVCAPFDALARSPRKGRVDIVHVDDNAVPEHLDELAKRNRNLEDDRLPPALRALAFANAIMILDEFLIANPDAARIFLTDIGRVSDDQLGVYSSLKREWRLARAAALEIKRREAIRR